jgi:diguanylate cyclase (GGDEF)-like protein/PAS domain S-box-containing protein
MLDGEVVGRVISVRDITGRRQAERSLRESQERYLQLFDSTPHPMWVYDLETLRFLAVNREAIKHYGYAREEFLRLTLADIHPPEDVALLRGYVDEVVAEKAEKTRLVRHQKKDGTIIDVEISTQPIEFGSRSARLALATDITERKRTDAALRESEGKYRMLVESTSEGLLQVDQSDRVEFVNQRLCEMVGYTQEELIGADWTKLLLDDEGRNFIERVNERRRRGISDRYEMKLKRKSGEILWVIIGGAPVINHEGKVVGSMGIYTDINERKLAEEQLLYDAFHDGLTGVANRSLFMDHLRLTIERGKSRHSNMYAVLFLDFDRFKLINDSLGHADGDKLLKLVARRIETCTRTGDLVGRLGGDEFVILLSELVDEADALRVAERIQESLKTPFDLSGHEVFISVSIGITLSTAKHECAEEMLRNADIAMYRAKAKGKAQHQVFDVEMHKNMMAQLQFETEMRYALERGEFRIHYQPIYTLATKIPVGFEALLRWQHPTRGLISPAEFIPLAEENGMIISLGQWTVHESCRRLREWQKTNPAAASLTVAVNLSCKEFLQIDLAEQIAATLASTGLEPRCLKLEITESHIMENSTMAITIMERLRACGVELSLDDFGTGYSSLSYLHRLPVSYLKVDRSFINGLTDSPENAEIVYTIVKLGQNLKMKVIAEGIETADQLRYLEQINCEYGQGYHFSKPLDAEKAKTLIEGIQKSSIGNGNSHELSNQPIINLNLNA